MNCKNKNVAATLRYVTNSDHTRQLRLLVTIIFQKYIVALPILQAIRKYWLAECLLNLYKITQHPNLLLYF